MSVEDKNPIDMYFDMKEGRVKLAQKEQSYSGVVSLLNGYIAMLRVLYIVYQHGHWKCKGPAFYGNHLLFERIYKDVRKLADGAAEKLIGIYGNDALTHSKQVDLIAKMYSNYGGDDHFENAIEATEAFLSLSEDMYNRLKEMEELTLGMDDMIMANASEAEEYLYLLKQARPE